MRKLISLVWPEAALPHCCTGKRGPPRPAGAQAPRSLELSFRPGHVHTELFPETCHKKRCHPVYLFSIAALTSDHKLGGLYSTGSSHSSGRRKSEQHLPGLKSRDWQG